MNSRISKIGLVASVVMLILYSACLVLPESNGNQPPVISSLEADYISVYPMGASAIRCVASDPEGDPVQLTWYTDGGDIDVDGATARWKAPNQYGDFHVMVIAKDTNGGSTEAVLTFSVVPRAYGSCCGR